MNINHKRRKYTPVTTRVQGVLCTERCSGVCYTARIMDYGAESLKQHAAKKGKLSVESTFPLTTTDELSIAYTPGIASVSQELAAHPERAAEFVTAKRTVAVVTDGSAVLGLGNIGPVAALPVMEGKAALFKRFADIDAFPIALNTQDVDEIVETIVRITPTFGGINLEDIAAPRCFEIEERLKRILPIPVFHDDQHGTAIVVLAALLNALTVTKREKETTKIVVAGSGAAGIAIVSLLNKAGFPRVSLVDRGGIVSECRDDLNHAQQRMLECCAISEICGDLKDVVVNADVFIGVSAANILTSEMVVTMQKNPIIFALANPTPEITPEDAHAAGAAVVATGRSDYPNQVNNVLAFPGIFKGAFAAGVKQITDDMKLRAAHVLAALVPTPTAECIIPNPFLDGVADAVADAVCAAAASDE